MPRTRLAAPRVVVVTGASAGVGRATAVAFAKEGARVGLLARGRERLEATRDEIDRLGRRALLLPADVASAAQVEEAADRVERDLGSIDVWVNNAMATVFSRTDEVTPEEFERAIQVTFLGSVNGTLAALRRMKARGQGSIVQVGSALAYRAIPLQAPYCAAKHALKAFTDSLRSELLHDGVPIRLTMVQLPALNTPQFSWCRTRLDRHPKPVGRIFQPEVAAQAIVWAARHHRREVFVGWPTVQAITAQKFIAKFLDRYLAKKAFEGQLMEDEPLPNGRPGNLFEPVAGDYGAHGRFDREAHGRSVQLWLNLNRAWLVPVSLGGAAALLLLLRALLGGP
jgi:NAD(P)-dependent dehydrogenase (short-subunit alcohol dehydrogenase family)